MIHLLIGFALILTQTHQPAGRQILSGFSRCNGLGWFKGKFIQLRTGNKNSCQERGWHILRGFSIVSLPNF
jgi:hypothetical protein